MVRDELMAVMLAGERAEEKQARELFTDYLRNELHLDDLCWRKHETPDYYLRMGSVVFAVEVTHLEVWRDPALGATPVRTGTYQASHIELVRQVEQAACDAGILHGAYFISFLRPMAAPRSRFGEVKDYVAARCVEYMEKTRFLASHDGMRILFENMPMCRILKVASEGESFVQASFSHWGWTQSPGFEEWLRSMLEEAIAGKRRRLVSELRPKILLLLNTNPLSDLEAYRRIIHQLRSLDFFHSIFVMDRTRVLALYAPDSPWPSPC